MLTRNLLVTGGRVALLLVALSAGVFAVRIARQDTAEESGARYVCPMHPEVTSRVPGSCSICRMKLVPVARDSDAVLKAQLPPAESPARATAGGFSVEAADLLRYGISLVRRHAFPQDVSAPAWVDEHGVLSAIFYKDEVAALAPAETARFASASTPLTAFDATRLDEEPSEWDRATYRVRFALGRGKEQLPAGTLGSLKLAHKARDALVVPASAVLESAAGPYVLVLSLPERALRRRPVQTGRTLSGLTTIVAGLRDKELVVAMNAFLMDAEWTAQADLSAQRSEQ